VFFGERTGVSRRYGGDIIDCSEAQFNKATMEWCTAPGETPEAGHQLSSDDRADAIANSVTRLDHSNDEHWTNAGLPSMEAVESFAGFNLTRTELSGQFPDLKRESGD